MKRDFPTAQQNMLASQTSQTKDMGLQEVKFYTCGIELDMAIREGGERVVRCPVCKQSDIHKSCRRACRKCEEIEEF